MLKKWLTISTHVLLLPLLGCTEGVRLGERVGDSCDGDRDCARGSFCLQGGDYPDGMCTHDCDDDLDCPDFARCVEDEGGVCLLECDTDRDCPVRYECDDRPREGRGGRVEVCRGD